MGSYSYSDPAHIHAVTGLDGTPRYAYDANGNMTSRVVGGLTYSMIYDAENRLVEIQQGSAKVAGYGYDGDGKRVFGKNYASSQTNPDKTIYIGDLFEVFVDADYTPTPPTNTCANCTHKVYLPVVTDQSNKPAIGQVWRTNYYAGGQRVAMRVEDRAGGASGVYWIYSDHLGSTSVTADSSGAFVSELRYKAWGETRTSTGVTPTQRRYTGQLEAEAGLYFYNARWFDPSLGRFAQGDTLIPQPGNPLDWDRYMYTINNPLNKVDPSGHCPICIAAAVGALIGGGVNAYIQYSTTGKIDIGGVIGASVAGAVSGTVLAVAAPTTIIGAIFAGGTANMAGNQVGALTEAIIKPSTQGLGVDFAANGGIYDGSEITNVDKAVIDFVAGGVINGVFSSSAHILSKYTNLVPDPLVAPKPSYNYGMIVQYPGVYTLNPPSSLGPITKYPGLTFAQGAEMGIPAGLMETSGKILLDIFQEFSDQTINRNIKPVECY